MIISEYIKELEAIKAEHGDLYVYERDPLSTVYGAVRVAHGPTVEHLAIPGKRERAVRILVSGEADLRRGDKIVRL